MYILLFITYFYFFTYFEIRKASSSCMVQNKTLNDHAFVRMYCSRLEMKYQRGQMQL